MVKASGYICKDCKQPFVMEAPEIMSFERKGMEQPKRCPGCRRKRREYKVNCLGVTDPRD